ncbi:hypothetical protein N7510_004871 [Penicillium lagena]|uniref:uncharacterized protein n=1 Tax=Penicillium lagena TaxID=94218 RepID=UPI0025409376|nr:uncharacterized protein N7510_004871 [Penicillium lagena]KAJ5620887.1 hypothetical protein N7510_004871 [Penicillium lagena]
MVPLSKAPSQSRPRWPKSLAYSPITIPISPARLRLLLTLTVPASPTPLIRSLISAGWRPLPSPTSRSLSSSENRVLSAPTRGAIGFRQAPDPRVGASRSLSLVNHLPSTVCQQFVLDHLE